MTTETIQGGANVLRFDGLDESKYEGWAKWARARLRKLVKQGLDEDLLGSELLLMLQPNTPAWDAVKHIPDAEIEAADGITKLWAALDTRFPKQTEAN
jgi:hypothetical protein